MTCDTSAVIVHVEDRGGDPLYAIKPFSSAKRYSKGEWVVFNGKWHVSLINGNSRSPHDRMVWSNGIDVTDLLAPLAARITGTVLQELPDCDSKTDIPLDADSFPMFRCALLPVIC